MFLLLLGIYSHVLGTSTPFLEESTLRQSRAGVFNRFLVFCFLFFADVIKHVRGLHTCSHCPETDFQLGFHIALKYLTLFSSDCHETFIVLFSQLP